MGAEDYEREDDYPEHPIRELIVTGVLPLVGAVALIAVVGDAIQRIANDGLDAYLDEGMTGFEFFLTVAVAIAVVVIILTVVVIGGVRAIDRIRR